MDTWKIKMRDGGGYQIFDGDGKIAGSYMNEETAAAHHAFALQRDRVAREALSLCHVALGNGKPIEETLKAFQAVHAILYPPMEKIVVEQ